MTEKTFYTDVLAAFQPAATALATDAYLSGFFASLAISIHEEEEDVYQRLEELHALVLAHLAAARAGTPPPMAEPVTRTKGGT